MHFAAHEPHNILTDGKPQPRSLALGVRGPCLLEGLEYPLLIVGGDSLPRIGDGECNFRLFRILFNLVYRQRHRSAKGRKFEGIGDKIGEHLTQTNSVALKLVVLRDIVDDKFQPVANRFSRQHAIQLVEHF